MTASNDSRVPLTTSVRYIAGFLRKAEDGEGARYAPIMVFLPSFNAYGDVLVRDADVFGPVVNLAARATKAARPGSLVISEELRDQLDGETAWTFEALPLQELKGFDATALFEVQP